MENREDETEFPMTKIIFVNNNLAAPQSLSPPPSPSLPLFWLVSADKSYLLCFFTNIMQIISVFCIFSSLLTPFALFWSIACFLCLYVYVCPCIFLLTFAISFSSIFSHFISFNVSSAYKSLLKLYHIQYMYVFTFVEYSSLLTSKTLS